MKNVHVIQTDKPSRLWANNLRRRLELDEFPSQHPSNLAKHIYITSDEITGFENNIWVILGTRVWLWQNTMALVSNNKPRKIILTTDQDLIQDGVQAIDDEFLEWFVKNPSCEEVEFQEVYPSVCCIQKEGKTKMNSGCMERNRCLNYKIIIPKEEPKQELHFMDDEVECNTCGNIMSLTEDESIYVCYNSECTSCYEPYEEEEPKQETLEEYISEVTKNFGDEMSIKFTSGGIKLGAKWQAERMYSEEDMRLAIKKARDISDGKDCFDAEDISGCTEVCTYSWRFNMSEDSIIEQFKK